MSDQKTWSVCILGIAVFCIGVAARMYMVIRLNGWAGYLSRQKNLTKNYRLLIENERASRWPILESGACLPLGVVIVFSAILFSK